VLAPPPLAPPALCFTGLSLPSPPKTFHREREPMGLRQRDNESEMMSKKKKNCEKEEKRGYQKERGQESKGL